MRAMKQLLATTTTFTHSGFGAPAWRGLLEFEVHLIINNALFLTLLGAEMIAAVVFQLVFCLWFLDSRCC